MQSFKAAAIQMTSGDDIAANIAALEPLVAEAVARGAAFVATPENSFYMRREGSAGQDQPMATHPGVLWAQKTAKQHAIWLLIGSIRALESGMDKPFNRSLLLSPEGVITSYYDKIHLFDVTLPGGHSYQESAQAVPGDRAVVTPMLNAALGLTICYDLRFPQLYKHLAAKGATMLAVPAAFTRPTGAAHWQSLLRARAIENGCYVIAPAQCGTHPGGRETYGHSLIIDPWGTVIAEGDGEQPGVVMAEIAMARVAEVRAQIPVMAHQRPFV